MTAVDQRRLHPDDVALWLSVEAATFRLAKFTNARLDWVRPMKKRDTQFWWGMYHGQPENGIEITLREWDSEDGWVRRPQKLYNLVEVIAHEVAHAKAGAGNDHNNKWFKAFAHCLHAAAFLNLRLDLKMSGAKFPPE